MSIQIFFLQLRGKIKRTEVVESERTSLQNQYSAYRAALIAPQLTEFRELELWVHSGAPVELKRACDNRVFKGSNLHQQETEFRKLEKSNAIRNYLKLESSRDLRRFLELKDTDKINAYYTLQDYALHGEYAREKREIELQKFSGSPEEQHLMELKTLRKDKAFSDYLALHESERLLKHMALTNSQMLQQYVTLQHMPEKDASALESLEQLKKNSDIKAYFDIENSIELRHYREVAGSHKPKRYQELLDLTDSSEFKKRVAWLQDKNKLRHSAARKKFKQYKTLQADPDIKFYLKFEKSKLYINYLDTKDSFNLKRYLELKSIISSSDFLKEKSDLLDKNKWEASDAYARLKRYEQLKKSPEVALVLKADATNMFYDFLKWNERFYDNFDLPKLDSSKWTSNQKWAQQMTGIHFSQPGDLHAYSGGANTLIENHKLLVQVKGGRFHSYSWNPNAGLVPTEFKYSSDTLSTYEGFRQEGGLFEAKIFFQPVKEIAQVCYLAGELPTPRIHLLEMGPRNRMGVVLDSASGDTLFEGIDLGHLKRNRWYIFALNWEKDQLHFLINGVEVFCTSTTQLIGGAHINLVSLVVSDIPASQLPVNFRVDWIRGSQQRQ